MSQNYDALNFEELQEESERLDGGNSGDFLNKFVKMPEKEGYVVVRLLPPMKGMKFYCSTRTHRLKTSLHCPREIVNVNGSKRWYDNDPKKPCPICRYYSSLYKDSEQTSGTEAEELIKAARLIKPIERYYYNCIVREEVNEQGEKEFNVGPKILSVGKTLHDMIIKSIVGDPKIGKKGLGDVSNIKNGRDFKIVKRLKKSGKDTFPYYDDSEFLESSPLGNPDDMEKWLASLWNLQELRNPKSHEELKVALKKYLGLIADDADTSFDLNEFKANGLVKAPSEQVQVEKVVSRPAVDEDESLTEEDFLAELKNI